MPEVPLYPTTQPGKIPVPILNHHRGIKINIADTIGAAGQAPTIGPKKTEARAPAVPIAEAKVPGASMGIGPLLPMDYKHVDITKAIYNKYAPSYIEIIDANAARLNKNTRISFSQNEPSALRLPGNFSNFDDAEELEGSQAFWAHTVVFGFQPQEVKDSDLSNEPGLIGDTVKDPFTFVSYGYSAVWVESIRDAVCGGHSEALFSDPTFLAQRRAQFWSLLYGCIAHEIGHSPGQQMEATDHAELGLMTAPGTGVPPTIDLDFESATIRRFRTATDWGD